MMVLIAPLAAQTAPKKPSTNAADDAPLPLSCSRFEIKVTTPSGATGASNDSRLSKRLNRPSAPTMNASAGKNASSELYAICWERPMQSSRRNRAKLRFSAASHSLPLSRSGELGVLPADRRCSVAVDKTEPPKCGFRLALALATEDQSRRRSNPACQHE